MGYAAGSSCFEDAQLAASHLCARTHAAGDGSVTSCIAATATDAIATLTVQRADAAASSSFTAAVTMQPCNPLTGADAVELGWQIVAVALALAFTSWLIRIIRNR